MKKLFKITSVILISVFLTVNFAWTGEMKIADNLQRSSLSPSLSINNNHFQQLYYDLCINSGKTFNPGNNLPNDLENTPVSSADEFAKVVLINANHRSSIRSVRPLGLARISAYLKQNNVDTGFIDANRDNLSPEAVVNEIIKIRKNYKGRLVLGLSLFPVDTSFLEIFLRQLPVGIKQDEDVFICAGGYLPTMSRHNFLDKFPDIDFIIVGEGEVALFNAVKAISKSKDFKDIENVIYRDRTGNIKTNPHHLLTTQELDDLPHPDYAIILQRDDSFVKKALLDTAHGCPGNCAFCGIHKFFDEIGSSNYFASAKLRNLFWRPRSAKKVVDEIEYLYNTYDIRGFDFVDDDFIGADAQRAKEIAQEIIDRGLKISFWILTRSDSVYGNEEIFLKLKEAGLKQVFIGVESNDARQLRHYGKAIVPSINKKAIEILQRLGIAMRIGLINFYKDSSLAQIRNNIEFIEHYGLQSAIPTPSSKLKIYKHTTLYNRYIRQGVTLIPINETEYDYEFSDERVSYLYSITSKFADETYALMIYFRELQEMHYYSPTHLSEIATNYYQKLKEIEFNFFKEVLMFVEAGKDLRCEINSELLDIEIKYHRQVYDLVKGFQDNLDEGYKDEIPFSTKRLVPTALDKLKKFLVEEGDCWVLHGDLKGLWERNFYYGREGMDVLINRIETVLGSYGSHLVSDEFVAVIPKERSREEVEQITVELISEILKYFNGKFGFAVLEVNEENDDWQNVLKNIANVKEIMKLPLLGEDKALTKDFLVFEKEKGRNLKDTLNNIVEGFNHAYGKDVLRAKLDLPMLAPLIPFGGVRAVHVSHLEGDLDEWIEDILRVAAYLQNIAKQQFPYVRIEEEAVLPKPEIEKEVPLDERNFLLKEAEKIKKGLKVRPYRLEELYPSYKRTSLYTIIRDILLYVGREVGLYKLNVGYMTSDSNTTKKMYEARGKRQVRLSDNDNYIFGLKSIWGIFGHKAVNTLILYLNVALNKIFRHSGLNYSVTIVRQPPEVFYLVIETEKGNTLPTAKDILTKLDELSRYSTGFLGRNFMLEAVFEVSLAMASELGNDVSKLIETVDFISEIRKSVKGVKSPLTLNRVDTYQEVAANFTRASQEYLKAQAKKRERAKEEIEKLIGFEEVLLEKYKKYLEFLLTPASVDLQRDEGFKEIGMTAERETLEFMMSMHFIEQAI